MNLIDLLLQNGDIVRIECPKRHCDDVYELIENTMKRRDWLCCGAFDGMSVKINGVYVERVNMAHVVAML